MVAASPIITVTPGPVVNVWQDSRLLAAVHLTPAATITLTRALLAAMEQPK